MHWLLEINCHIVLNMPCKNMTIRCKISQLLPFKFTKIRFLAKNEKHPYTKGSLSENNRIKHKTLFHVNRILITFNYCLRFKYIYAEQIKQETPGWKQADACKFLPLFKISRAYAWEMTLSFLISRIRAYIEQIKSLFFATVGTSIDIRFRREWGTGTSIYCPNLGYINFGQSGTFNAASTGQEPFDLCVWKRLWSQHHWH